MRIAVVGAGVSGLTCALLLAPHHEVTLYEREPRLGGHANTVLVCHEGREIPVDTGFIVFNERNYPKFCRLLDRLGVASQESAMSFSVRDDVTGFEYGGASLLGALGSPGNLLRPRWWSVVRGVANFGRRGKGLLAGLPASTTVGDLYARRLFSRSFLDDYFVPMAASIWSAPRAELLRFPARFVLEFFDNHGMLDLRERPRWRTIRGGSRSYVGAVASAVGSAWRIERPVREVRRIGGGVKVRDSEGAAAFDAVIMATHSDQALALLGDPTPAERSVLGSLPYQPNEAVLHTDASVLPKRRRCWAAWNYRVSRDPGAPIAVTYNLTMLQRLDTRTPICVTLNDGGVVDPGRVIARHEYHHPLHTPASEAARGRWGEISGVAGVHFCGAYWGAGFHEDGVASAVRVCEQLGASL